MAENKNQDAEFETVKLDDGSIVIKPVVVSGQLVSGEVAREVGQEAKEIVAEAAREATRITGVTLDEFRARHNAHLSSAPAPAKEST